MRKHFILIALMAAFAFLAGSGAWAAEKKPKKAAPAQSSPVARVSGVDDSNILDYYKTGEDQVKKGRLDEAYRSFQGVYGYTRDALVLMQQVKGPYEKALNDPAVNQDQREDLYLKLQRMGALTTRYTGLKGESAY